MRPFSEMSSTEFWTYRNEPIQRVPHHEAREHGKPRSRALSDHPPIGSEVERRVP